MSCTTQLLTELLDNLYEEKDNLSNQNVYLTMCNLIKKIGESSNNDNYYNELLNERDNINYLRISRNKLIKENNKLKKMIK